MKPAFKVGDTVFLASAGLGKVADFAGRGPDGKPGPLAPGADPEYYVVEVPDSVALVPLSRAQTLRPLVSRADAQAMLDALRDPRAPDSPPEPLLERGKRVVHSGTPFEHARFLRELYALPVPLAASLASGLLFMSRLVLPEIAAVLALESAVLEREMQERYGAARDARDQEALLRFR